MKKDFSLHQNQCFQETLPQSNFTEPKLRKSTVDVKQTENKALSTVHETNLNEHVERISNIQNTFLDTCIQGRKIWKKK